MKGFDMSWKWGQAVADQVLDIVGARESNSFQIQDLYEREASFRQQFPRNQFIKEKIRQTLQFLRDFGFLRFTGAGQYELNTDFTELQIAVENRIESDSEHDPRRRIVTRRVILRDTLQVIEMKRKYNYQCQVCREYIDLSDRRYAEGHHLRPLGQPHRGPDCPGNIIIVCPNHHVMFDRGAVFLDPVSLVLRHSADAFRPRKLYLEDWHQLHLSHVKYHCQHIFQVRRRRQ